MLLVFDLKTKKQSDFSIEQLYLCIYSFIQDNIDACFLKFIISLIIVVHIFSPTNTAIDYLHLTSNELGMLFNMDTLQSKNAIGNNTSYSIHAINIKKI